jgi:NAD(P)-dependent dehydrogenase (short-subunit alcohol dehydrogenase family)
MGDSEGRQHVQTLLVVGVSEGGLGQRVVDYARKDPYIDNVWTADVPDTLTGDKPADFQLDVRSVADIRSTLRGCEPTHIICTTGINYFTAELGGTVDWRHGIMETMEVNALGVVTLAREWSTLNSLPATPDHMGHSGRHFVAVSSNSAHIARTQSAAYCMSKAALSMGIRCLARDAARQGLAQALYVYEPGFLNATPMSLAIVGTDDPLAEANVHRIPSGYSITTAEVAHQMVAGLHGGWNALNGACIRLDGGEQ